MKRGSWHGASWVAVLLASTALPAADPGADVPAKSSVLLSVRDLRPLLGAVAGLVERTKRAELQDVASVLRGWEGIIDGRISLAVHSPWDVTGQPPFICRIPVKKSEAPVGDLVRKSLAFLPGLQEGTGEASKGDVRWETRDGVLYAGTVAPSIPKDPQGALAATEAYRRLGKHVDWEGDVTVFVDLEALAWKPLRGEGPPSSKAHFWGPADVLFSWLHLDQWSGVGFSWTGSKENKATASGRVAVLTETPRRGLSAFLDIPNAKVRDLERLPGDCRMLYAVAPTAPGFVARLGTFMDAFDADAGREFRDELAAFERELGIHFDKDLLGRWGSSVTAIHGAGLDTLGAVHVSRVDGVEPFRRAVETLARYNETPVGTIEHDGRKLSVVPLGLAHPLARPEQRVYLAFEGGRLHGAMSPEALGALLRGPGDAHLAASPLFQRLRRRLPEESVFLWAVDVRWFAEVLGPLLKTLPAPTSAYGQLILDAALEEVPETPGLSVGFAIRNEPDAFVLAVESLAGNPWELLPKVLGKFSPRR